MCSLLKNNFKFTIRGYIAKKGNPPKENLNLLDMTIDKQGWYDEKGMYRLGERLIYTFKLNKVKNKPIYKFKKYNKQLRYFTNGTSYLIYIRPNNSTNKSKCYFYTTFNQEKGGEAPYKNIKLLKKQMIKNSKEE